MSDLERLKIERKKELLAILEAKKRKLQLHFDEGANKALEVGKGMVVVGAGVLLLYTILDRYLESKFRSNSATEASTKSTSNKLIYPLLAMVLQQGTSVLINASQKKLVEYLKNKKLQNDRLSGDISKK